MYAEIMSNLDRNVPTVVTMAVFVFLAVAAMGAP